MERIELQLSDSSHLVGVRPRTRSSALQERVVASSEHPKKDVQVGICNLKIIVYAAVEFLSQGRSGYIIDHL